IDRARDYREPGYLIVLAALAVQLATGWLLAWRGRAAAARLPPAVAALAGAFLIEAAALPLGYWEHRRAVDAGLDLQSDAVWGGHALLAAALTAGAVAIVYSLGRLAYRRFGPLGVAVAAWLAVAAVTLVQPLVVDPLFVST